MSGEAIKRIEEKIDQILKILNGSDESGGLITKVALVKQSNRRLWVFAIIIFTSMVGLFFK